jgi:zinc finger SWIM domain-containing protein 3
MDTACFGDAISFNTTF